MAMSRCFNPRTQKGATFLLSLFRHLFRVSIHAPKRVRPSCLAFSVISSGFQSTHPKGCDRLYSGTIVKVAKFQSTHPKRCDRKSVFLQPLLFAAMGIGSHRHVSSLLMQGFAQFSLAITMVFNRQKGCSLYLGTAYGFSACFPP